MKLISSKLFAPSRDSCALRHDVFLHGEATFKCCQESTSNCIMSRKQLH